MTIKASMAAPATVILASLLLCLTPERVSAQQDSLSARLLIPSMPVQHFDAPPPPPPERRSYIFPGVTVSSPTALGAEGGTVYLGVGYQNRIRYRSREDGAVVAGVGIGNAHRYVALEMTATSYSTVRSGWLDRMGFGAQIHRYLNNETAVAVGGESLFMINGDKSDTDRSLYGVLTRLIPLQEDPSEPFSLVTATVGLGTGRFRPEDDVFADRKTVGLIAAVSVHVIRPIAVLADWYGQDLGVGLSIAPLEHLPLVITPAFMDVTNNAGDGARFVLGVGLGHRVTKGPIQF